MNRPPPESTTLAKIEVGSLTAEDRRAIADTASLLKTEWTTLEKAPREAVETIARLLKLSFPDITPVETVVHFYILGNRLYPNAAFWMSKAAAHPDYRGQEQLRLTPEMPEWTELMGNQDPAKIAAAVKTIARKARYDRAGRTLADQVEPECGYCPWSDAILSDTKWLNLRAQNRDDAEKEARELAPAGVEVEVRPQQNNRWAGRYAVLKPDAPALALKTARSRSSRRALLKLFPLVEARATTALDELNRRLEQLLGPDERERADAHDIGGGLMLRGAGAPTPPLTTATDEYGARQTPRQEAKEQGYEAFPGRAAREHAEGIASQQDATGAPANTAAEGRPLRATSTHDPAADRAAQLISEKDRTKLYADLDRRDISGLVSDEDPHEALHVLIRRMKKLPPNAPASTKDLTYPEWEQLRHAIDALPPLGDAAEPRELTQDLKRSIDDQGGTQ